MKVKAQEFRLLGGQNIVIRPAGEKETDAMQMAAVHLESFNQNYITHPHDPAAIQSVRETFRDKTLQGYTAFWSEEIEKSRKPEEGHFVLVAESTRWINGRAQSSIEAVANIIPVKDGVWERVALHLPEDLRVQARWYDYDLIHIRDQYRRLGVGSLMLRDGVILAAQSGARHMFLNAFDGNASPEWFLKKGFRDFGKMPLPYGGKEPVWRVTGLTDFRTILNMNADDFLDIAPHDVYTLFDLSADRSSCSSLDRERVAKVVQARLDL